ncbi:MAG: MerR family transcriptional regulator [Paracoccaceae bacterium]
MSKSPEAFRTISEVADWLGVQAHVLRFWESKFTQVKPVKRAGGRRYYRPADMLLLGGIRKLLHDDGLTIKGVQKLLREEGVAHVADLSRPLDDLTTAQLDDDLTPEAAKADIDRPDVTSAVTEPAPEPSAEETPEPAVVETAPKDTSESETKEAAYPVANENPPMTQAASEASEPAEDTSQPGLPFGDPLPEVAPPATETGLPSFLHRPSRMAQPIEADPAPVEESPPPEEDATAEPTARPAIVDVPHTPDEADYAAEPSILSRAGRVSRISTQDAGAVKPLLAQLAALRDQMASAHQEDRGR